MNIAPECRRCHRADAVPDGNGMCVGCSRMLSEEVSNWNNGGDTMTKLIGLAGRRGSGKDSLATLMGWNRVAFADTLRDAAEIICGFTKTQMLDPEMKDKIDPRWGWSPRWFLQRLGTEVGRSIDPAIWVKAWEHKVRNMMQATMRDSEGARHPAYRVIVATDVRFPNEVAAVRSLGGKVYRVVRPWGGPAISAVDAHDSEHALDNIQLDGEILNSSTLENLRRAGEGLTL